MAIRSATQSAWTHGSFMSHLECSRCDTRHPADRLIGVSRCCDAPLLVRYDLEAAREAVQGTDPGDLFLNEPSLWHYAPLLPDPGPQGPVSLQEGGTPLLGTALKGVKVSLKDETRNPTGTFKARGMALAVTRARALGVDHLRTPTAGNAGGALATYAARAGLQATIAMPRDAAPANKREVQAAGARLIEVDGLIGDCARVLSEDPQAKDAFDVSTLHEPYRMEGKKTMGYELWEQNGGTWPDVVVFPTGGGMGILAIEKAHHELTALGLEDGPPPRLVAVQSEGCAPLAKAFEEGKEEAVTVPDAHTLAGGIRVPTPKGDRLVLRTLRRTGGSAVTVSEDAILEGMRQVAQTTGLLVGPESGASYAGLRVMLENGDLDRDEHAVAFLTGTGLKHLDSFATSSPS